MILYVVLQGQMIQF